MPEQLYTVAPKDCLWDLCQRFYQKPLLWPQLFAYNNRPEIIRGTAILDPDLILIGQKLVIPSREQLTGNSDTIKAKVSQQRADFQRQGTAQQSQLQRMRQLQPLNNRGEESMGRNPAKPLAKPTFVIDLGESKIPPVKGVGFRACLY